MSVENIIQQRDMYKSMASGPGAITTSPAHVKAGDAAKEDEGAQAAVGDAAKESEDLVRRQVQWLKKTSRRGMSR